MSAYLVFDHQNSLIFSHCDSKLERLLLRCNPEQVPLAEAPDQQEVLRNLFTLYLTPYVSAHRRRSSLAPHLDGMPHISVAHQNWGLFVFVHLRQNGCPEQAVLDDKWLVRLQRKTALFCHLVLFLYGNALHSIDKYEHILKTLLKMMAKWDEVSEEVPFMVESIERLFLGFHLENVCKQTILRIEQYMKLQMHQTTNGEIATCHLLLYKDRLLYKQESGSAHLRQEDMLSILLLSLSMHPFPALYGDLSSEGSNFEDSLIGERACNSFQHLVFLKSSHNLQIPVPHIYRKVSISEELYFVSLTEISSILMICLPTLLETVTEIKHDLTWNEQNSSKAIENLTSCVRNVHKYMDKNMTTVVPRRSFNLNVLPQLNELLRRANTSSTELVREQADRIMSLVLEDLHSLYEEVVFKCLYMDQLPLYMANFEAIAQEVSELLRETFSICLDYVQVKYETNSLAVASVFDHYLDLDCVLFIDRQKGYFFMGNADGHTGRCSEQLTSMFLHGYRLYEESSHEPLLVWSEHEYQLVYWRQPKLSQWKDTSSPPCTMARILQHSQLPADSYPLTSDTEVAYELFCIFHASPLNEQISQNNILDIEKLIKLYINR